MYLSLPGRELAEWPTGIACQEYWNQNKDLQIKVILTFPYTMTAHSYDLSGTFYHALKIKREFYIKKYILKEGSIEKYAAEV